MLLYPTVNANPNAGRGGADITIINETALVADGVLPGGAEGGDILPQSDQLSIYVVRPGDSLSQIAEMFGVSTNTIIWANDLPRSGTIRVGETLVILPVSGIKHTVAKGDTLKSIAQKYKGDIEEIAMFNGIREGAALALGSTIIVPDGVVPAPPRARATTPVRISAASGPSYEGYYGRPVDGVRSQGLHGYNGVDIAASSGTPVYASASGDVSVVKYRSGNPWFGGYGNYIIVSHDNGTQTLYAHLSGVATSEGWRVAKGQVIGYVGSTGRSTGPHLHFEVRGARNPFR